MKRRNGSRFLALLIAMIMLIGMIPVNVFAASDFTEVPVKYVDVLNIENEIDESDLVVLEKEESRLILPKIIPGWKTTTPAGITVTADVYGVATPEEVVFSYEEMEDITITINYAIKGVDEEEGNIVSTTTFPLKYNGTYTHNGEIVGYEFDDGYAIQVEFEDIEGVTSPGTSHTYYVHEMEPVAPMTIFHRVSGTEQIIDARLIEVDEADEDGYITVQAIVFGEYDPILISETVLYVPGGTHSMYYTPIKEGGEIDVTVTFILKDSEGVSLGSNIVNSLKLDVNHLGEVIELEAPFILGYFHSPAKIPVVFTEENLNPEVSLNYTTLEGIEGEGTVTITYLNVDDSSEIQTFTTETLSVGNHILTAPVIEGYVCLSPQKNITIFEDGQKISIRFIYKVDLVEDEEGTIVVRYRSEDDTQKLAESLEEELLVGESKSYSPIEIKGYEVVGDSELTGTIEERGQIVTLTFKYRKIVSEEFGTVILKYEDESGAELSPSAEINTAPIGETIHYGAKPISGYVLVGESHLPAKVENAQDPVIVTFVYRQVDTSKEGTVKIISKDYSDEAVILGETTETLPLGGHRITAPHIEGYIPKSETQLISLETEGQEVEITFLYEKVTEETSTYIIIQIDHDTEEELGRTEPKPVKMGATNVLAPSIEDYRLEGPGSFVVMNSENGVTHEVVFRYKKIEVTPEEPEVPVTKGVIDVREFVPNGAVLGSRGISDVVFGVETEVKATAYTGYTVIGSGVEKVTLSESKPSAIVSFRYTANTSSGGGGGGGGGVITPPVVTPPVVTPPVVTPPVVELPKNLVKPTEVESKEIIAKDGVFQAISEAPITVKDKVAVFNTNKALKDEMKSKGLTPRIFQWNESKSRWVPVATVESVWAVKTESEMTGNFALFGVQELKFNDAKKTDWFNNTLNLANGFGIVNGFEDGKGKVEFRGNKQTTTAEFYTMVARLFGTAEDGVAPLYNILPAKTGQSVGLNWYSTYQTALKSKGFIDSLEDLKTMNGEITRIDAMVLVTKLLKAVEKDIPTKKASSFKDAKGLNVEIVDIIEGYGDGTLRPDRGLTRAEALKIIIDSLTLAGW